ncbi:MAG TPA: hypothetical protein H9819_05995 [Candidatus Bacteroides merdipullorum]|uniref:Uncharacterized protein n=1 Tax=Candidatus Bacteroides merdipullorum TaxID=2838474 RepID=A0A9D2CXB5_9BACE|nr:hypothetical protein [Candidatus Bacteroides merdipullorum]
MKKLHDVSQIYVFSPGNSTTGGIELLHQLVDYLRNQKQKAYIYYYNAPSANIPDAYKKYNISVTTTIEDAENNVIVLPEICFHLSKNYTHAQTVLWWLSVNNYYHQEKRHIPLYEIFSYSKTYGLKQIWHRIAGLFLLQWRFKTDFSIKDSIHKEYIHAYQSEYAKQHLQERGVSNLYPLKDYINTAFISDKTCQSKKPAILYNPKKGLKFTRKLMKAAPDLRFIPLQNLSRTALQEMLSGSALYIDFGNHPGMDRLPREAAVNGCCIITGRQGAAQNDIDIPIPAEYKFDERTASVLDITRQIRSILADYESHTAHFETYRDRIKHEQEIFYQQIDTLFRLNN